MNPLELQETLGQMTMLSKLSDRPYRISVRDVGEFRINWSGRPMGSDADVLLQPEGEEDLVRITRSNMEEKVKELLGLSVDEYLIKIELAEKKAKRSRSTLAPKSVVVQDHEDWDVA